MSEEYQEMDMNYLDGVHCEGKKKNRVENHYSEPSVGRRREMMMIMMMMM